MFQLGVKVTDRITGFSGVVTGHVRYITGCNQVLVVPRVKADGSYVDAQWFDEQRLRIETDDPIVLNNSVTPGCDMPAPVR